MCVFLCLSVHASACVYVEGGCRAVTAVTQPWSRGGEGDGKGGLVRGEVKILK